MSSLWIMKTSSTQYALGTKHFIVSSKISKQYEHDKSKENTTSIQLTPCSEIYHSNQETIFGVIEERKKSKNI